VRVAPPMGSNDRPLVFGRADAFGIETVDATTIVLTNRTTAWASFVLLVVPKLVAGAAVFPWRQFLEQIKAPDGLAKAGMAILHRLQQQYLDPDDPESRTRDSESRPDRKPEDP
jgi:hypothetical protein